MNEIVIDINLNMPTTPVFSCDFWPVRGACEWIPEVEIKHGGSTVTADVRIAGGVSWIPEELIEVSEDTVVADVHVRGNVIPLQRIDVECTDTITATVRVDGSVISIDNTGE